MSRCVAPFLAPIVIATNDVPIPIKQHGTYRNITVTRGLRSLFKCLPHGSVPIQYMAFLFYTPHPTEGSHSLA